MVDKTFIDNQNLATNQDLKSKLFGDNKDEKIIFSDKVEKKDRWNVKKTVILTISNYGKISIISEELHVHWTIKLSELKCLTWINDDK